MLIEKTKKHRKQKADSLNTIDTRTTSQWLYFTRHTDTDTDTEGRFKFFFVRNFIKYDQYRSIKDNHSQLRLI